MKRDEKGRFAKSCEDGLNVTLGIPPVRKIVTCLIIAFILLPWVSILSKFNVLRKILDYFEFLLKIGNEEDSTTKKMDYFINSDLILLK